MRARMWTDEGLDDPDYGALRAQADAGYLCIGHHEVVDIPITATPVGDINVVKAAIHFYDKRHESGEAMDNVNLKLMDLSGTPTMIRRSSSSLDEYEFVAGRGGAGTMRPTLSQTLR